MSIDRPMPDYDLDDQAVVTAPAQLRAMSDPLRSTILELVLERSATVTELAAAVGRPKSTVAHHVGVLVDAGMLRVVRTRRVRAIDERYYGRTARLFRIGKIDHPVIWENDLSVAAAEARAAYEADVMMSIHRHARIPRERGMEFWEKVLELVREFSTIPRSGDTVFGFVAGLYPTDHPALPDPSPDES